MWFNSYPTNADKNRANGSVPPSYPFAQEPVPRSGVDGGAAGPFSIDVVTDFDGVPVFSAWTNSLDVLCITGIAVGQSSVWMRVSWPINESLPSSSLDVFSASDCDTNIWTFCDSVSVLAVTNEIVVAASIAGSPISALGRHFFRVGTKVDSDGDGLSDAFERLVSQTDPLASDSDGDGLPDGWEYENGLDPNLWPDAYSDADGDGIPNLYEFHNGIQPQVPDAELVECIVAGGSGTNAVATLSAALAASSPYSVIEVADGVHEGPGWSGFSITLPNYPVLITSSDGGRSRRAIIRHTTQYAAMYLNATQTTHTVVQGLCYDLVATNGAQMAFWCGGNLPWSGPPAGGMFRNIYVRMPNPGVEYEGWFFRHYESNEVVLASCTINAYGATSARGIYAVDSPPMSVENCTFVNFPSNEGGLGYGIQYESTVQNWGGAPDPIPLEIVNCLFDASFTNAYALAPLENGVAYDVSMINCVVPSLLEYEADFTYGLIVTNARVSFSGHIAADSPVRGAGVSSLFAPLDIDGQDRAAVPDIGADQFVPGAETLDTDGDGISDVDEDWVYGSDPFFADSDGDGSPDGAEISNGTDPLDRLSHFANVALTVTNTFPSASVTNYFGFSMSAAGWDVTNVYAATTWGASSNVVATTAGLYGKAFSDLNRNGIYDEDADVIRIVCLESEYAIVNAIISLGDIDGDGVSDARERGDGTDPYDRDNFLLRATVKVLDSDAGAGITNFIEHFMLQNDAAPVASNAFVTATKNYPVSGIVTEGRIYVRGFRDIDRNGVYDAGVDGSFSLDLTRGNNGATVNLTIGDSDGDNILDSVEMSEGSSPMDRLNYCFNCLVEIGDVFTTTNGLSAQAMCGDDCIYGPAVMTNSTLTLDLGHLVATNGERVVVYFWDDYDGNATRDEYEPFTSVAVYPRAHDVQYVCSLPYGGFDANADGLLDWWQLYHRLDDGAYADTDCDGLINLHEYWAGCDPLVPDGSNTLLSVMSRSVDDLIASASSIDSLHRFENYQTNGLSLLFVSNTNCWGRSIDFSCASMWNDAGHDIWGGPCERWQMAGTAISRRHVICARHYSVPNGATLYFMSTSNVVVARQVVSQKNVGYDTDIHVCVLDTDLPDSIVPAKILSADYENFIRSARGLPLVTIDQEEKLLLSESNDLSNYAGRANSSGGMMPRVGRRSEFYEPIVSGDSGSPRFAIVGNKAVLLYLMHYGGGGSGCFVTHYKDEIQQAMNDLCNGYYLEEMDMSPYQDLSQAPR
jgi:hypothetical protein